ncbi:hypothetical protein [Bacillus cereus]|uniref:Uncharacterized protein n=1 Tax=Bacillus cereus VD154 TaxID=1053238 RepID=A0A9W5KSC3_BACCE|nr:hypothetical protein [Bacillus cereus]EJR65632.1 hypothetical protein IK5_05360 [Bacillus cereus VD154]EJR66759.1 hypothetical protein IK5_05359 [Bacillus cereus VD154]
MGIRNIFQSFLGGSSIDIPDPDCQTLQLKAEIAYKKLYVNAAIDLIARSLIACDFESYRDGKLKRHFNYYQLNVAPNRGHHTCPST